MTDARSIVEKRLWDILGPPLYYCEDCLRTVYVTEGAEPIVKRSCDHTGGIIAPRKSILAGEGGLSLTDKARMTYWKLAARMTGRCV